MSFYSFKLKMKYSRPLCANPDAKWVQKAMTIIPEYVFVFIDLPTEIKLAAFKHLSTN